MRTVYLGTGDIGIPSLELLAGRAGVALAAVVTGPDRPVGRHQTMTPPATKRVAENHGIPVFQPAKAAAALAELAALEPDLFVVMAYGALLPRRVIECPRLACINLHASLLPRHRGASPIQAAIAAGDTRSGVTAMHVSAALDEGDLICARELELAPDETGGSLHDRLAGLAPLALGDALDAFAEGAAPRTPQNHADATYLGKLTRADGAIDWTRPAPELERLVRAFDPWPGTTARPAGGGSLPRVKVFPPTLAAAADDPSGHPAPGTVTSASPDSGITVACGDRTTLTIHQLQPEGKRRMSASDFLAGHPVAPGARFG